MATLSKRGVRTLFLFSPDEGDLAVFVREFGPSGAAISGHAGVSMRIVPGMDHSLMRPAGRDRAEALTIEFLSQAEHPAS